MTCGDKAWWREPDFAGLLERHGQIEHLIIQLDFLKQLKQGPRTEFSIPGASKSTPGMNVGFADIVSVVGNQVWEIKPKHLEVLAAQEAIHYRKFAKASCKLNWSLGNSYQISDSAKHLYGAQHIVYRAEAPRLRYELVSRQGIDGAVIYTWHLNGKEIGALDAAMAWAVRGKVLADYFGKQTPAPIKGAKPPPNDVPPIKFKPPVLAPGACIPLLQRFVVAMNKAIWTTYAGHIIDGGGVAVLLEEAAFNAIFGPINVAKTVENLQIRADPQVVFAHALYTALNIGIASFGIPYAGWMVLQLGGAVGCALAGPVVVPPAVTAVPAVASTAAGALGAELLAMFSIALKGLAPTVAATTTTLLVVAVPRVSQASPGKPVTVDLFPFKFQELKPREMISARVGQTFKLQGAEHYIVGLAETPRD